MHIVYIPSLNGYQARTHGGGTGKTRFVAVRKAGGHAPALRRLRQAVSELTENFPRESRRGKLSARNRSGIAGVALAWREGVDYAYPYVVGNWTDALGRQRCFSRSIDRHGFESAVRFALARRKAGGAPVPTLAEALRRLRAAYPEAARW